MVLSLLLGNVDDDDDDDDGGGGGGKECLYFTYAGILRHSTL